MIALGTAVATLLFAASAIPAGQVTVTVLAGSLEESGMLDGSASEARFDSPQGVAIDGAGRVYVADMRNEVVRRIDPDGSVHTHAGIPGQGNDQTRARDGDAFFALMLPIRLAVDARGTVYVAESSATIRKVTPEHVSTVAGVFRDRRCIDGSRAVARFQSIYGIALDRSGVIYVSDDCTIRRVTPAGDVRTLAGAPECDPKRRRVEGVGTVARMKFAGELVVGTNGSLYVADHDAVLRVTSAGDVRVLWHEDGRSVGSIAQDHQGNVYVAEWESGALLRISRSGTASVLATLPAKPTSLAYDRRSHALLVTAGEAVLRVTLPR